jgi:hypothetical protein
MWAKVVQHEFAKQAAMVDKRDKGQRADVFRLKYIPQCNETVVP